MLQGIRIKRSAFRVAAVCALVLPGCAAPLIPSQRFHEGELPHVLSGPVPLGGHRFGMQDPSECTSCEDRQRLGDYAHSAMPYVAGPFMHPSNRPADGVQQATIQPPHSKFHPVPTRPVFETRAEYHPPQPMGVQLLPVPEYGIQSTMPGLHQPDLPLTYPTSPPAASSESLDTSEHDEADSFILQPPSN